MTNVGFLGTGTMGTAMVHVLLEAGMRVHVWNRSRARTEALAEAGAHVAEAARVAACHPIVHSMLANDAAVLAVFTEEFLAGMPRGSVHVGHESVSPEAVRELARRHVAAGVGFVAAPVIGRPDVARAGKLNVLAAGESSAVDAALDMLEVLSARVWRLGHEPERAVAAKIAVNYTLIHTIETLGEAVALAEGSGIAASEFVELLTNTLYGGVAHRGYGQLIVERLFHPVGFSVELGRKDLRLATALATSTGVVLPTAEVLSDLFAATLADPALGDADWSALAETVRRLTRT